jgi:hypothetical protein
MGQTCGMLGKEMLAKFLAELLQGSGHFGDLGIGERIILKWSMKKQDMKVWTGFICPWRQLIKQHEACTIFHLSFS